MDLLMANSVDILFFLHECIIVLRVAPHPPTPVPILGEGEPDSNVLLPLGEMDLGVRATKVGCTLLNDIAVLILIR